MEICILIQLFLNALLMAEVQYQASDGFVFYGGYLTQRWIVFGVLCVMSILLSAAKIMKKQGSMKIINVTPAVMDVFTFTGMADALDIEAK